MGVRTWAAPIAMVCLLALAGCASGPTDLGPTLTAPTAADELAFRLDVTPSSPQPPDAGFRMPELSVYGDGLVVRSAPDIASTVTRAWPVTTQQRLSPAGIDRLLNAARDAGLAAPTDFGTPNVMDAPATIFTVPGRVTTVVLVDDGAASLDSSQRAPYERLQTFTDRLADLDAWLGDDLTAAEPYSYTQVAVSARAADSRAMQSVKPWPLDDLAYAGVPHGSGRCVIVAGDQLDAIEDVATDAAASTRWLSADARFHLTFRPLLPDEAGCNAIDAT
ncbi:hypothetical protein B0I08_107193 [Glaciihabitans tibetensis]|uniref:Uncharacterized protein n=1 Tax=Glaciihabitans tibetensis TaxID=1266600 RepID=A0A2T0VB54_9MICO|nr:hypothetical protein [Glaciihabitans tibetensis]PRY67297.1 hypothetical protein B0I08_107193 [Glaciihabitans tibetensis]